LSFHNLCFVFHNLSICPVLISSSVLLLVIAVKCAQWKRLPYSWMILNQRRVQSNCGRYVISDVFCTTYKNLVYKLLCLLFYIIFYLCPFCLTGSITLEPLTASKYCTILWIRNGINCFLQLLIYYLCTLGFACFYNASIVPAISEDCVCYLILLNFLPFSLQQGW